MTSTSSRRPGAFAARPALLAALLAAAALVCGCHRATPTPAPPAVHPTKGAMSSAPRSFPLSARDYPWARTEPAYEPLAARFAPPEGSSPVAVADGSYAQWLRHLPLRATGTPVRGRDGAAIVPADDPNLAAVIDIDVRANQQCADTITRLRAEYLYHAGQLDGIVFRAGGGSKLSWPRWKQGFRPHPVGDGLEFSKSAGPDGSRKSFEAYLNSVFCWCGTYNLADEGHRVQGFPAIGDFFVSGGSPGHAVIVVDLAKDAAGQLRGLLAQGYMPDQSAHVLAVAAEDPWFPLAIGQPVDTPFWGVFQWTDLRRFD